MAVTPDDGGAFVPKNSNPAGQTGGSNPFGSAPGAGSPGGATGYGQGQTPTPYSGGAYVIKPGDPNFQAAIAQAMAVIKAIESGGNYYAKNPNSSASGAYQFIDSTWNGYGGYAHASSAPAAVQDAKARQLITYILMAHGYDFRWIPAVWYAGPAGAMQHDWNTYLPSPGAGNKLTVGAYVNKWMDTFSGTNGGTIDWTKDTTTNPNGQPTGPTTPAPIDPQPYIDLARQRGENLTVGQANTLIKNLVSLGEWQQRLDWDTRIEEQKPLLDAFAAVLRAKGLYTKSSFTYSDAWNYLKGVAPSAWYETQKQLSVAADARNAGLIPGGTGALGLTGQQIIAIANRQPGAVSEGALASTFGQLAQDFKQIIPQGRWTGFGVTKADLIALEFGSAEPGKQQNAAELVQKVLNTYQASQQPRANPQAFVTQGGPAQSGYGGTSGGATQ